MNGLLSVLSSGGFILLEKKKRDNSSPGIQESEVESVTCGL